MNHNLLPPTTKKAAMNTCPEVNEKIRSKTLSCLNIYKDGDAKILSDRMEKLNREWDTERVLETNAASLVLLTSIKGFKKNKSLCFLVTGAIGFFLLQHALLGWCPPLPIIRKLCVRTQEEINNEKMVLKLVRGDFMQNSTDAGEMLGMTEK